MAKIKLAKTFIDLPTPRHAAVMNEIEDAKQTDRGIAIVGAAYIDLVLREAITAKFNVQDDKELLTSLFENRGPLQDFASRIHVAFALGACGRAAYNDLRKIKDIRNAFAHSAQAIDFQHEEIAQLCADLWYPKTIHITNRPDPQTPRERYIRAVGLMTDLFHMDRLRKERGMPGEFLIMASGPPIVRAKANKKKWRVNKRRRNAV
jgi:DNA-binding MltR family transcriptional regulator